LAKKLTTPTSQIKVFERKNSVEKISINKEIGRSKSPNPTTMEIEKPSTKEKTHKTDYNSDESSSKSDSPTKPEKNREKNSYDTNFNQKNFPLERNDLDFQSFLLWQNKTTFLSRLFKAHWIK